MRYVVKIFLLDQRIQFKINPYLKSLSRSRQWTLRQNTFHLRTKMLSWYWINFLIFPINHINRGTAPFPQIWLSKSPVIQFSLRLLGFISVFTGDFRRRSRFPEMKFNAITWTGTKKKIVGKHLRTNGGLDKHIFFLTAINYQEINQECLVTNRSQITYVLVSCSDLFFLIGKHNRIWNKETVRKFCKPDSKLQYFPACQFSSNHFDQWIHTYKKRNVWLRAVDK